MFFNEVSHFQFFYSKIPEIFGTTCPPKVCLYRPSGNPVLLSRLWVAWSSLPCRANPSATVPSLVPKGISVVKPTHVLQSGNFGSTKWGVFLQTVKLFFVCLHDRPFRLKNGLTVNMYRNGVGYNNKAHNRNTQL